MILPSTFHFSQLDQMNLSAGAATKLLAAFLCGGLVGLEREARHKASGLRTNMLLCMGCALFTLLSPLIAGEGGNHAQIASNIVQGIGFLGAGLILHTRSRVLGLTSAATVFVVAAIGMACGAGLFLEAAIATVIVIIALQLIGMLEGQSRWKRYPLLYEARGSDATQLYKAILKVMDHAGYRMNVIERDSLPGFERVTFVVTVNRHRHAALLAALRESKDTDEVVSFADTEQD